MITQLAFGFIIAAAIAGTGWKAGALSASGAFSSVMVGGIIFGLGGLPWAILLVTFFFTSSLFSIMFKKYKSHVKVKFSKGSQVVANGGFGATLALAHSFLPGQAWLLVAFAATMAAVNADTWATEIGILSRQQPRLITTGERVETGTSGGVTLSGTLAALAGSALIAGIAALLTPQRENGIFLAITLGGMAGALFDSTLGATVQAVFYCPTCKKETERYPLHSCGEYTTHLRGWLWLNNDRVNFGCSLMGAIIGALLIALF